MAPNKTWVFKKIPDGLPVPGKHIATEDRPTDLDQPAPKGGLVLDVQYASFDPYLRGRMRDPAVKTYVPAFHVGEPIVNHTAGRVLKTGTPDFKEGDIVVAFTPIAEYVVVKDPKAMRVRKIHNPHNLDLGLFVGALGMPGRTAWSGLYKIGKPKKGETIFVSSAAGAVGQAVGQIAKKAGLTVIGSVGSEEKKQFVIEECGFDSAFNYKKESPFDALPRLAPQGIDIYFENVGGEHLDAALANMNDHGRIPVCGMIANYNTPREKRYGMKWLDQMVVRQLEMEGFLEANIGPEYFEEHQEKMQKWIADGSVKIKAHVTDGIDNASEGFVDMLEGRNFGKALLKVK